MATSAQVAGAIILFALYGAVILYLAIRGSRRTRSMRDYAVGSVNFSPVFVGLSLAAAMTSAATFVINPGLVANFGVAAFLSYGVFFPLATLVSLVVLTKSFRKFGTSVKAVSLAGWIGARYDSKGYALFIGFLAVLLIAFIVLILVALAKVVAQALNADEIWVLAALVVFIFGYMMFGGANSMIYTNAVQAMIMIGVALILIGSGIQFFNEGLGGFFAKLRSIDPALVGATNKASPLFRDFWEIAVAQIIVGAAVVCQPHIITRSLLLKKESQVNRFLVTAVIAQMLFFLVVIAGFYARMRFPEFIAPDGTALNVDSMIPVYVVDIFSGGVGALLIGLFVILGLMSAGFSTVEGLIQSLGTTITTDIIKPLAGSRIRSEKSYVAINRAVIAAIAVVSFFLSWQQLVNPKLSVAIFAQNGVYSYFSVVFAPILLGIFLKKAGIRPALTASLTALTVYAAVYYILPWLVNGGMAHFGYIDTYLSGDVRNPAIAASTAILLSIAAGLAVYWFDTRRNRKQAPV